jgi:hypothetical protein
MIEVTDRYGGNPPAWFTACLECEGMGVSPELCAASSCPSPAEHDDPTFDGWHFVRCDACNGTARVSRLTAISRIPRWLVKSTQFFVRMAHPKYKPSDWSYRQHVWLVFRCAFVFDVLRLFR